MSSSEDDRPSKKDDKKKRKRESEDEEDDAEEVEEEEEEEEDEEDEEDEEEEEDRKGKGRRKKKQKKGVSAFFDEEAEVGDDEEDEDEAEDDWMAKELEGEADLVDAEPSVENVHRRRGFLFNNEEDQEKEEEYIQSLNERVKHGEMELDDTDLGEISQQSLLPSVKDPKLWLVRCKQGKEKEAVISLMSKFFAKAAEGQPLQIKSASATELCKGYIYVEAEKEAMVRNAVQGIRLLNFWAIKLVPINEMVDVYQTTKADISKTIQKDSWVRVKRGIYAGDLAQVWDIEDQRTKITVKLIPRLDFSAGGMSEGGAGKKKANKFTRPPARFFNAQEALNMNLHVEKKRDAMGGMFEICNGMKFKDGYLYKTISTKNLDMKDVNPPLDEVQRFQGSVKDDDASKGDGLSMMPGVPSTSRTVSYVKGDTIKVIDGDLKNLTGSVLSVTGDMITILPAHEDLKDPLVFPANQLTKWFKVGDHVKVTAGRYTNETGLIVRVEPSGANSVAVLFTDVSNKEVKVFTRDLSLSTEISTGQHSLGNYELGDLIQLNPQTVGMVVKVDRESFGVLTQQGVVQLVPLQDMGPKRNNKMAVALDSQNNTLAVEDMVRVTDGPHKGKQGTIKHLHRAFVFIHSPQFMSETGGHLVVRARHCLLMGAKKENTPFMANRPMGMGMGGRGGSADGGRGGFRQPMGRGRGHARKDDLVGSTVTVTKGPWKGYLGIVIDTTDKAARIELHSKHKVINIDRSSLVIVSGKGGVSAPSRGFEPLQGVPQTPSWAPGKTPMRTPHHDDIGTPLHTPSHDAWDPSATATPIRPPSPEDMHPYTPVQEYSTPGSSFAPQTPGAMAAGLDPTTPGNYHTPYSPAGTYGDVATPNVQHRQPFTPAAYTAATPGSAYTPGDHFHETPTPGQSVVTPGLYSATTPGTGLFEPGTPGTPGAHSMLPHTPGAHMDYEPHSPGMRPAPKSGIPADAWYSANIMVKVTSAGQYYGHQGVIRDVLGGDQPTCHVHLLTSDELIAISPESLEPIVPTNKDTVKIIKGDYKGNTGHLIGIDGTDGIVRLDENYDLKILDMSSFAKLYTAAADV